MVRGRTRTTQSAATTDNVQRTALLNQQEVTVRQSQALAQVYVHASLSAIAWLRDLFSDDGFVLKSSHDLLDLKDYDDYVKNAQRLAQIQPPKQDGSRAGYETLVSGRLPVVDMFLDQITCAFSAVQQKVLSSLVVSVCMRKDRPQDVIESYVFTFAYRTTATGPTEIENVTLSGTPKPVKFGSLKTSLSNVLKQINMDLKAKPQLPRGHCLHVSLLYNDDWDGHACPSGFKTDEVPIRFAETAGWEKQTASWIFDAGYKAVSLGAIRMKPKNDSGIEDNAETDMPAQKLTYGVLDQTALVDRTLDQRLDDKRRIEYAKHSKASAPTSQANDISPQHLEQQGAKSAVSQIPSQITSQLSTQHREDFTTRRHLDAALNAPPQLTNGGDTQLLPRSPSKLDTQLPSSKIKFANRMVKALDGAGLEAHSSNDGQVECECACKDDVTDLLKCAYCKHYQHLTCYGYTGPDDARVPDVHLCYTCLLVDEEAALLIDLRSKASLRRVAKAMLGGKLHFEREIAKAIGRALPDVSAICDRLIREGFMTRTKKNNRFRLDLVEGKKQELLEYLFDPASMITHHLAMPYVTQLPNTMATEQFTVPAPPPPAPQKTPVRLSKRKGGDVNEEVETPISKRRRVRTQRGAVLDANRAYVETDDEKDPDEP